MQTKSKYIVVTGASRGIGFQLIQLLALEGHSVLALSRNIEPIESLGLDKVRVVPFDISLPGDVDKIRNYVETNSIMIDGIVHNAGKLINKPFSELTTEDFREVYDVNVFGVANLTQALLPAMADSGHVVAISSMGGIQGSMKFPGLAAYSSGKGAVITLFEVLAEEYKESGIAFNVLALGAVQTEMLEEAFPGYQAPISAKDMAGYIKNFVLTAHQFYKGKILQVSRSTP